MKTARLRKITFAILLTSFAIITASVIFFTLGYRFNFERGIFVYTGSITIKVIPDTVDIRIDGKLIPQGRQNILNQSIHLSGIDPGEHLLKIEASGYQSWEKKVSVGSGVSTEFWNIILPKDSFQPSTLLSGSFLRMFPSPSEKFLALFGESGDETTLAVFEKSTGLSKQIFSTKEFRFDQSSTENLEWSSDEKTVLFSLKNDKGKHYFLINRETLATEDISSLTGFPNIHHLRWDPKEAHSILFLSEDSLFSFDTRSLGKKPTILGEGIAAYDPSASVLFYLERESGIIYQSDYGEKLSPDPLTPPIKIPFTDPTLVAYDKDRIALFEKDGQGILFNQRKMGAGSSILSLGRGIRSLQFSNDGKKLLFATENEISVIFTREWDMQPSRSEGDIFQIVRLSKPVASVQWTKDYEHILFTAEGMIQLAELDHRDHRNIATLGNDLNPLQVLSDFQNNEILILGRESDAKTTLYSLIFPRPLNFFGN